jgi:hypothetical protein
VSVREFKRILFDDLPAAESEGWRPAVTHLGSVGVDPFSAGHGLAVLVERDVESIIVADDRSPDGAE